MSAASLVPQGQRKVSLHLRSFRQSSTPSSVAILSFTSLSDLNPVQYFRICFNGYSRATMLPILLLHLLTSPVRAQYPPHSNLTTIVSPVDGNITISFKTPPNGTCETVFDTQKQYTGWVNIPGDYPANIFFWFVEARAPTDHLTIWLNGGPGSSSMHGMFTGNGPCEVVELGPNKLGTVKRPWGWDRGSNMLYIDQVRFLTFLNAFEWPNPA